VTADSRLSRRSRAARCRCSRLSTPRTISSGPLVLVGMGRLNDADEVLFVQLQSPGECGSAGCSTVSFRYTGDRWIRIMDTVGGAVRIAASHHRGMPDLIVGERNRLMWDGIKYVG
jgi:hypothetical protein